MLTFLSPRVTSCNLSIDMPLELFGSVPADDGRLAIGFMDFSVPAGDENGIHAIVK